MMENYKINFDIPGFKKKLLAHLEKRMESVVVRIVGYVISHFGPSNLGGNNPSTPGSAPNVGIGTLRNNISYKVIKDGDVVVGMYGVQKGPASDYGSRLEMGFVGTDKAGRNINQLPRPFLAPAYKKNMHNIIKWLTI